MAAQQILCVTEATLVPEEQLHAGATESGTILRVA